MRLISLTTFHTFTLLIRGIRYHLKEQRQAQQKASNAYELFNLRHASLRNAVERISGTVKRRFQILDAAPEYSVHNKPGDKSQW